MKKYFSRNFLNKYLSNLIENFQRIGRHKITMTAFAMKSDSQDVWSFFCFLGRCVCEGNVNNNDSMKEIGIFIEGPLN